MARIRTIKPAFFRHVELYDAEKETGLPLRVAFAGLWTVADREGRFKWQPRELKLDCLPHDEVDFSRVLDALTTRGFVVRYASQGVEYAYIPSFTTHQIVNNREAPSSLPDPEKCSKDNTLTRATRVPHASTTRHDPDRVEQEQEQEGKGKEVSGRAASPRSTKGTRWPPDAIVPEDWIEAANNARLKANLPPLDLTGEAAAFPHYWASRSGREANKTDWKRVWINRVLSLNGGSHGRASKHSVGDTLRDIASDLAEREAFRRG